MSSQSRAGMRSSVQTENRHVRDILAISSSKRGYVSLPLPTSSWLLISHHQVLVSYHDIEGPSRPDACLPLPLPSPADTSSKLVLCYCVNGLLHHGRPRSFMFEHLCPSSFLLLELCSPRLQLFHSDLPRELLSIFQTPNQTSPPSRSLP